MINLQGEQGRPISRVDVVCKDDEGKDNEVGARTVKRRVVARWRDD